MGYELTRPYLCPETLMLTTLGRRKSHSRSGCTKGATKPPLAASTKANQRHSTSTKECPYRGLGSQYPSLPASR